MIERSLRYDCGNGRVIVFEKADIAMPCPTCTILSGGEERDAPGKPVRKSRRELTRDAEATARDTSVERIMDEAVDRDRERAQSPDLLQEDAGKE